MKKKLVIEACLDCPLFSYRFDQCLFLDNRPRNVYKPKEIPDWCPLEEAE